MIAVVSACLLGMRCRFDLKDVSLRPLLKVDDLIPVPICPEQLGGLPTPRKRCEIVGGDGFDVLNGKARVLTVDGEDVTENLLIGAKEALKVVKIVGAELAIMRDGSPSCGCGTIYDGTFSGRRVRGYGVTSAFLSENGVRVVEANNFITLRKLAKGDAHGGSEQDHHVVR